MNITFITGNQHKADYAAKWLGVPVAHKKLSVDEIQSVNLQEIVEHKAHQAFGQIGSPVLVEDVSLEMAGLNGLPGPFIKWFLEGLGPQRLADLATNSGSTKATVRIMFALYDGTSMHIFDAAVTGTIVASPRGSNSFGFSSIFAPDGAGGKTNAEMTDDQAKPFNHRALALQKFADFLQKST
ncbi:MAG TPA: non-canonical purine NTP pyrophosphatase [Candidatus Saccharimonadales bacterium]|nr:non-canonical purine NTP pyrophosphatase [Candidatus Saccharimonadales bacterium]